CSVESTEQTLATAHAVKAAGGKLLRGGAYKPRTSPYSFRGMGVRGLEILAEARAATGLGIVTEVMSIEELPAVAEYADMLQIGARNMQNYNLLEAVGRSHLPVLLKRGLSATVEEWLLSAEYVMAQGNRQVVLCERGIRTFDNEDKPSSTRNTLDVVAVPLAKQLSHLPVIADPSQATGRASLVSAAGLAAVAAGADGLIVEVHPQPDHALSDAAQQLTFEQFGQLTAKVAAVAHAIGRSAQHSVPV
ncbi:MAG: 3-deoxy-7-phosphoheptulonate synthase, partial [Chloroflexota bacterium]|nr:3-deoxy-7-phosphoheptulonate synthase [Chloroflexota bacterium]